MTIAFIPVRGGSKSIPLKNIKPFCGKPLVCWSIEALVGCSQIDSIVVATDSDTIYETVASFHYTKTVLYRRNPENASDTASTESVMLEYIQQSNLLESDTFILVQATSPLTRSIHFEEALTQYGNGRYDSMLSCVKNFRFFWSEDGHSINYDYQARPRRQNFEGMLMENGAFYINKVGNILLHKNRLCGRIGIYEMPEYTGMEIDEPDDWIIMEEIMRKHEQASNIKSKKIKLFFTDIDGTLTDGGMYYSEHGDELKKFNTRDGMGLSMLHSAGIKTGIITSENCELNKRRCMKLKVDYVCQGRRNDEKLSTLMHICDKEGVLLSEVAYIGDDINCLDVLKSVGIAACPSDACKRIKDINGIHIMAKKGGEGCVREFIDEILAD